ncbi:hypothetical protein BJ508DRAFT_365063 [Ascobolus immersus RN42]|uniref:Uncharacterized protein n=1 Tax=Ascobolus immersus RN42 TaxID=1160509 RepID=A0A3N4HRC3_ASCIM|nr:hypothetical protein BJ508DRAFT_365063 [Ascobolus immersus RN42]
MGYSSADILPPAGTFSGGFCRLVSPVSSPLANSVHFTTFRHPPPPNKHQTTNENSPKFSISSTFIDNMEPCMLTPSSTAALTHPSTPPNPGSTSDLTSDLNAFQTLEIFKSPLHIRRLHRESQLKLTPANSQLKTASREFLRPPWAMIAPA